MPRQVFAYDPPQRFVAGTVGQPGDRTFYLQASGAVGTTSVALEKVQVQVLAERLEELLETVRRTTDADVPAVAPRELEDTAPLDAPVEEEFRVGALGLAWDAESARVVIEALAQPEDEAQAEVEPLSDAEEGPAVLRVVISADAARAFVKRAQRVVAAGRPPCPLCGLPLDPEGHVCPRQNGHRR
ncbi:MAG: DUF3090 family protein [Actinomycetota bacterium]|jgi:uncharacterized repeat protein (TIGR03847 family)|nr:DUF3090 family protein [Actinomycetota bacterium]